MNRATQGMAIMPGSYDKWALLVKHGGAAIAATGALNYIRVNIVDKIEVADAHP